MRNRVGAVPDDFAEESAAPRQLQRGGGRTTEYGISTTKVT